jgi:hypothetical protein
VGLDQARGADRIPAFDIVRNRNAEVASVGTEIADCTKDDLPRNVQWRVAAHGEIGGADRKVII